MARMNVNPTRMELTRLKRRLNTAVRGHKLLKDKRDELMKQFLDILREAKALREEVDRQLGEYYKMMVAAKAAMSEEELNSALIAPKLSAYLTLESENIMSVNVPKFEFHTEHRGDSILPYGFLDTNGELDAAITTLSEIFKNMLTLAEKEKACELLAEETEKTRRRVNSLEYVMIPNLKETIKFIQMKLDENERGNTTRLMKVKDMMIAEQFKEKA